MKHIFTVIRWSKNLFKKKSTITSKHNGFGSSHWPDPSPPILGTPDDRRPKYRFITEDEIPLADRDRWNTYIEEDE